MKFWGFSKYFEEKKVNFLVFRRAVEWRGSLAGNPSRTTCALGAPTAETTTEGADLTSANPSIPDVTDTSS
jgi:hypothetical protein